MWGKRDYLTKDTLARVAASFDAPWYSATYRRDLEAHRNPGETPFDFYLRMGARIGHDPHANFSELNFRTDHGAVYRRLLRHPREFGYLLFVGGFRGLFGKPRATSPIHCENLRMLTNSLDRDFIAATYAVDKSKYISELDFYLRNSRARPISPSREFSEERARENPVIAQDIREGRLLSGYHQFVVAQIEGERMAAGVVEVQRPASDDIPDDAEMRRRLEETIPGCTRPAELGVLREIEYLTAPITINRRGGDGKGFLVFIPYYIPELFFGGYLTFFELLRILKDRNGGDLKLVIVRKMPSRDDLRVNIERIKRDWPTVSGLFSSYHLLQDSREIDVDGGYGVISFCGETHFVASDAARQLNVTPYFHIPDYEPAFSGAGSVRSLVRSSYELPHHGLYNSRKLYEYFRDVAGIERVRDDSYRYVTFENAIKPMPWDRQTFQQRHLKKGKKRLVVYARPESVGARNDFGMIVLALKEALRRGTFDESGWSFHGIGAMTAFPKIELSARSSMEIVPKLPLQDYEEFLLTGDIGISVISTPHPGIIHFQMAAFGLTAITYAYPLEGRTPDWLVAQSPNLIPCQASIDGLCQALAEAVKRCSDVDARYENALRSHIPPHKADMEAAAAFCASS